MRVSPLRALSFLVAIALLIWVAARVSESVSAPRAAERAAESGAADPQGAYPPGADSAGSSSPDFEAIATDPDTLQLVLIADGEGWICRSGEREFRDVETLSAWIVAEHVGRNAQLVTENLDDIARVVPVIKACTDAGLARVNLRMSRKPSQTQPSQTKPQPR